MSGGLGSQGTQFDALGHFGFLDVAWPGTGSFPAEQVRYYNGFTQSDVKPVADGPLRKLGVDKAVPIVTSAVMLDAKAYRGRRLNPGEVITAADIVGMLSAQGIQSRGILPGDAVFIHTGWGELWTEPSQNPLATEDHSMGPGLAVDAQDTSRLAPSSWLHSTTPSPIRSRRLPTRCPICRSACTTTT